MRAFKLTFIGAGSTIFAKNVVGDCLLRFQDVKFEVALYDIDLKRLDESKEMLESIKRKYNACAIINTYENRIEAIKSADFIVNAVQIGGYESTMIDFEIKYAFIYFHKCDTLQRKILKT